MVEDWVAKIVQFKHELFRQIKHVSIKDLSLTHAKVYQELRYKSFYIILTHIICPPLSTGLYEDMVYVGSFYQAQS